MYENFSKAIKRRQSVDSIVSLSGGLDSRAILAESPKGIVTYCYGRKKSLDVTIAEEVASLHECKHHFFELSDKDWFKGKLEGIWKNDGMSSCFHMHFSQHHETIGKLGRFNMNGFLGDVTLGGSYLSFRHLDERISKKAAYSKFSDKVGLSDIESEYFNFDSTDPYFIYNRGVRFISMGSVESSRSIEHRKPFLDYELMDFTYSLPDSYRWYSKAYNHFLLRYYPNLFDLPWQRTGFKISKYPAMTFFHLVNKAKNRLFYRLDLKTNYEKYVDYKEWIKEPGFVYLFKELMRDSILKEVLGDAKEQLLEDHLSGKRDNSEKIGNLFTAEIYLQQVFNGKFMSQDENIFIGK